MLSVQFEPPLDEWKDCLLPLLCEKRVKEVCCDIMKMMDKSRYPAIYDAIYELCEADIDNETFNF